MNKSVYAILTIIILFIGCGGNDSSEYLKTDEEVKAINEELWEEDEYSESANTEANDDIFYSKDGKFKIDFMGEPTRTSDNVPTEAGNIEMISYMYEKSVTEVYMVAYGDYPSTLINIDNLEATLDGAKSGSSSSIGITNFDKENNDDYKGFPARYFKGSGGSIHVEYQILLVRNRLFQIAILRDGSYADTERSKSFFDSFEIVGEDTQEEE